MPKTSRILITLSILATLAISQGAVAKTTTSTKKKTQVEKVSKKKSQKPKSGRVDVPIAGVKVSARVEGGSTGDGPLSDSECAELANDINHSLDEMESALLDGDDAAAQAWSGIADTVADGGLEGGCFFTGIE